MIAMKLPEKYKGRTVLLKEECAEVLQVSERKIEYWIEEGKIRAVRVGHRSIRIVRESFEQFLASLN